MCNLCISLGVFIHDDWWTMCNAWEVTEVTMGWFADSCGLLTVSHGSRVGIRSIRTVYNLPNIHKYPTSNFGHSSYLRVWHLTVWTDIIKLGPCLKLHHFTSFHPRHCRMASVQSSSSSPEKPVSFTRHPAGECTECTPNWGKVEKLSAESYHISPPWIPPTPTIHIHPPSTCRRLAEAALSLWPFWME
jgi:hypothetical protein